MVGLRAWRGACSAACTHGITNPLAGAHVSGASHAHTYGIKMALPRLIMHLRAVGACLLLAVCASAHAATEECAAPAATLVSIEGVVETRARSSTEWQAVAAREVFCAGDMVRTQANSRAALHLSNNSIMRLSERSTVTFTGVSQEQASWLDLQQGIAHFISRIRQRFEVITPYVNAAVEGTEFIVAVDEAQAEVTVLEGRVRAKNDQGELMVTSGAAAMARAGQPPMARAQVRPWDAVSWALYYPPVIDFTAEDFARLPEPWGVRLAQAVALHRQGNAAAALAEIESLPADAVDRRVLVYRAALYLSVGQADSAGADLDRALETDARNGEALALKAIIAVVKNEAGAAQRLAEESIQASPESLAPLLARSYAAQARFDLATARASAARAVQLHPQSALAWSRLAELHLMFGEHDAALQAAQRAVAVAPDAARAQTVLGFVYLTRIDIAGAEQAFQRAIERDQADPLPRMGLGLALIRRGALASGRRQIEYAASLDPGNALVRSYLGKAYYEEKRHPLAADQLAMAKELDPNDPTPWYYDAIRKQSENRPVEALADLEQASKLNDNRAVYRSRLLLDEDAAARSAGQARVYRELGFQQSALIAGWQSLVSDPGNFAAHRFLADAYSTLPRHEIARVSELLQAQLRQPLTFMPLQPQLSETNLSILEGAGPSDAAYHEYNALFTRNRVGGQVNTIAGGDGIRGDDAVVSLIHDRIGLSLGQFHYESDGYRLNNDQEQDIYQLFLQAALTYNTSIQAELKSFKREKGDLVLRFDPDNVRTDFRETEQRDLLRLGLRHDFTPRSQLMVSLMTQGFELSQTDNPILGLSTDFSLEDEATLAELQYLQKSDRFNLIAGFGHFESDSDRLVTTTLDLGPFIPPAVTLDPSKETNRHSNAYAYLQGQRDDALTWLLGLSADSFDGELVQQEQLNPKIGVMLTPMEDTVLRMAAFRVLKRDLVTDQTLEPTQVFGFNQFFDDDVGTDSKRFGMAVDHRLTSDAAVGVEWSRRRLDVPFQDVAGDTRLARTRDNLHRGYLHYVTSPRTALRIEYLYEKQVMDEDMPANDVLSLTTRSMPLAIEYFDPRGWSFGVVATHVDQEGMFRGGVPISTAEGQDQFWVLDATASCQLPMRHGKVSLQARNLLGSQFMYQDQDPNTPSLYPQRLLLVRLSLSW